MTQSFMILRYVCGLIHKFSNRVRQCRDTTYGLCFKGVCLESCLVFSVLHIAVSKHQSRIIFTFHS